MKLPLPRYPVQATFRACLWAMAVSVVIQRGLPDAPFWIWCVLTFVALRGWLVTEAIWCPREPVEKG